jgi:hypothetical protein
MAKINEKMTDTETVVADPVVADPVVAYPVVADTVAADPAEGETLKEIIRNSTTRYDHGLSADDDAANHSAERDDIDEVHFTVGLQYC